MRFIFRTLHPLSGRNLPVRQLSRIRNDILTLEINVSYYVEGALVYLWEEFYNGDLPGKSPTATAVKKVWPLRPCLEYFDSHKEYPISQFSAEYDKYYTICQWTFMIGEVISWLWFEWLERWDHVLTFPFKCISVALATRFVITTLLPVYCCAMFAA